MWLKDDEKYKIEIRSGKNNKNIGTTYNNYINHKKDKGFKRKTTKSLYIWQTIR